MTIIEQIINTFNWAKIESRELADSEKNALCEQIALLINWRQDIAVIPVKAYRAPFYVYCAREDLKDFHTFNGYKPKTLIFYNNYCELELLRIAYLLGTLDNDKNWVYEKTKQRIRSNCFGRFCPNGECFETSIAALRFVGTVFSEETEWIGMYMKNITETILVSNKKIPYQSKLYFLQTLYEINTKEALRYIYVLEEYIHHLEKHMTRSASDYQRMNGQIIRNVCDKNFRL